MNQANETEKKEVRKMGTFQADNIIEEMAGCQAHLESFFPDCSIAELFRKSCKKICARDLEEAVFIEVKLKTRMEDAVKGSFTLAANYAEYSGIRRRIENIWYRLTNDEGARLSLGKYLEIKPEEGNRISQKKYQIFISSTYEDLIEERRLVQEAVLSLNHFPVGMERFGAAGGKWDVIKSLLDCTDYFVLLVGHRYGSVSTDENGREISFTQREYEYAVDHHIPVLAFFKGGGVPVKPDHLEKNKKYEKMLKDFKQEIEEKFLVYKWTDGGSLAAEVTSSLVKEFIRTERPGWIRMG